MPLYATATVTRMVYEVDRQRLFVGGGDGLVEMLPLV
eukprot:SAG11_NODE_1786_length_4258_cov_1.965617_3_plen_37_part_00